MNACRAVLLLAALTCSAHAADLIDFSPDHVTIRSPYYEDSDSQAADDEGAEVLGLAIRTCRHYAQTSLGATTRMALFLDDVRQGDFMIYHFACSQQIK